MAHTTFPLDCNAGYGDFVPNIHWAKTQQALPAVGAARRIIDFEWFYVIHGEILVHFEDTDVPLHVSSGDMVLLPPAITHRIELLTEPYTDLLGIHFDFFRDFDAPLEQELVVGDREPESDMFCKIPVDEQGSPRFQRSYPKLPPEALEWTYQLISHYNGSQPGKALACRGLLLQLLALLVRLHEHHERSVHPQYREQVLALMAEMMTQLDQAWSNAALARRLGVSEDHFIRIFRDIAHISPHQYLQNARHREAKRLLLESSLSIGAIGQLVGYGELANFSKSFKKWQGVTPSEYRSLAIM